jgi:uncharacterized membrane protein (UPF0127 family)
VTNKKKNKKGIIIAAILLLALALYILKPIIFDSWKSIPKPADKSITMEPQFSKEGTLVFQNAEKDTLKMVDIEIAENDQRRTQGMMYRTSMSYNRAMLFIMEYERQQSFWMRNTKMSLDIIYINGDKEIVTIYPHTQPYSVSPIPSFKKSKYVVETAAGFCDKYGIKEGSFIEFSRTN